MKPRSLAFRSFSDGLWLSEGIDYGLPPNALLVADNVDYTTSGGVRGRRGRSLFAALTDPIRSVWRHYARSGDPSTLVAQDVGSSTRFKYASGTSSSFSTATGGTGYADGLPWYFTNWPAKNLSYLANGSDPLKSFDGTTIATVTSSGAVGYLDPVPDGPYLVVHKSRLWATKSDELNYSVYASDVNDPTNFLSTNQLSINDPRGGKITGLVSWNDLLLIFKTQVIERFVGDIGSVLSGAQLGKYCDYGCTAPNTIAPTPYGVIYVGKGGVYMTDGVTPVPNELSQPIRALFTARATETAYENAVGQWYPRRNQYVLKLDPTASEAYVLTRLEILYDNQYIGAFSRPVWIWSKETSLPCAAGTTMSPWFGDSDDGRLLVGDASGNLWIYDADSQTTDNGTAITCKIQTMSRPFTSDGQTGRVSRVKALYRGSVALSGKLYYDQAAAAGSTFSIGSARTVGSAWSRSTILDFDKQGRFVSVELSNATDSYQFELNTVDTDYQLRSERAWADPVA